jgi:hypothetical protein
MSIETRERSLKIEGGPATVSAARASTRVAESIPDGRAAPMLAIAPSAQAESATPKQTILIRM